MKILIIYAHPNTIGHCSTILKEVQANLDSKNIEYELIDLYKIKYDPILHENEHYTAGNFNITKQNQGIQEKIRQTNKFIFIYPVWWNTMPAVLKGFFDRILTPHFAYYFKGRMPIKLLKGKKALVFITLSSTNILSYFFMGDRAKKIIKKEILGFCGINSRVYKIGNATNLTEKQIKKIKIKVKKGLNYLYS
mgnify:CR=1 FL=1